MLRLRSALVAAWCVLASVAVAAGQADEPSAFTLRSSFKSSALFSRLPDDLPLFPDRDSATGFWRFRIEPTVRLADTASIEVAVEQRLRVFSSAAGAAGVLPAEAAAPFRIRQLDWRLGAFQHADWRIEVDRAALHARVGAANLTLGRQAIGWGRGVLFSAVDLFAPFTPLEADREWRRGIDAVRADIKLSDRVSIDAVGAVGADADHSIVAARLRGYAGKADVELVGGRRARDVFGGVTSSAAVGDVEVHGELAVFRTPAVAGSIASADSQSVIKAVAGGSYRVPLGAGLLVYGEYHYSGFGASSAAGILGLLGDPAFQERYARGDTQILGRHALAALTVFELSPEVSLAAEWLQSPADGSGVFVPSSTLTFGDRASMVFSGYVPYGRTPIGTTLQSEFGASPLAIFVQLRLYR